MLLVAYMLLGHMTLGNDRYRGNDLVFALRYRSD